MKNILIIGGSYFVGRVFVEELLKRENYRIYVLNRGNIPIRREEVTEIVCDRHDTARAKQLLPELAWSAVVDFCAYTPDDISSTLAVIPAESIGHYIYVSTCSVYAQSNDLPIVEHAQKITGSQPELGPFAEYGYNKWRAELQLESMAGKVNIPYTSIRPAFIYGKYNYAPRESYFFDLIIKGETIVIPETGLSLFSFVSVWDVAAILLGCLENERTYNRAFNASAGELVSYRRLMEILEEITETPLSIQEKSIGDIEEMQIPLPFPLDEHLIYSGTCIQSVLDFSYTPLLKGMHETYRYYRIGHGLS
jgi:nucleoside-diphosphate-sugar epimerase